MFGTGGGSSKLSTVTIDWGRHGKCFQFIRKAPRAAYFLAFAYYDLMGDSEGHAEVSAATSRADVTVEIESDKYWRLTRQTETSGIDMNSLVSEVLKQFLSKAA
jgi:hypothetical protein